MSMRMKPSSSVARSTSRRTFANASSSSTSSPRCVSFSATFARSCSSAMRCRSCSYSATTICVVASSCTASPSSVVFACSPCAFRRRSAAIESSIVSPATKRPAPSRMPCVCTNRWTRGLSAAARIAFRDAAFRVAAAAIRVSRRCVAPSGSGARRSGRCEPRRPESSRRASGRAPPVRSGRRPRGSAASGGRYRRRRTPMACNARGRRRTSPHIRVRCRHGAMRPSRVRTRPSGPRDPPGRAVCASRRSAPPGWPPAIPRDRARCARAARPVPRRERRTPRCCRRPCRRASPGLLRRTARRMRGSRRRRGGHRSARRTPAHAGRRRRSPACEAFEAERVGDRVHVGNAIDDAPSLVTRRTAVPRPVVLQQPHALLPREVVERRCDVRAGARRAVVDEDRPPIRVAGFGDCKRAAVGRRHVHGASVVPAHKGQKAPMSEEHDDNKEHTGNPWAKTSSGDADHVTDPKREGGEEQPERDEDTDS